MKTSVMGAINVLGMAKRCRAKVLQASTSEVYGDPEVHPQPESYRGSVNPIGPRACYDEGKRAAETLFMDYHRANRVNVRIVRIFNTYGPRMHPYDGRVVSNFIRQALCGEPITIFGSGGQTRSFCYRDDLIEGMIRMMNGPDDFVGPVAVAISYDDVIAPAKILSEFVKDLESVKIKSGVVQGQKIDKAGVQALAKLPGLNELRATILSMINQPATKLVRTIKEPGASLARVIKAKSDKAA
jgi:nucleoside-diphosphate-sugar epimerase